MSGARDINQASKGEAPTDGSSRMKPRRVTDMLWVGIFIAAIGALGYVTWYAHTNGKPAQFETLYQKGAQVANSQVANGAQVQQYKDEVTKLIAIVMEVLNEWQLLLVSGLGALVGAFTFLFLLKEFAPVIIRVSLLVLVLCPIAAGGYLIYVSGYVSQYLGLGAPDPNLPSISDLCTGCDINYNLYAGAGVIVLGLIIGMVVCCSQKSITLAVDCVEVGVNATFAMPSMLIAPVIHLLSLCIIVPVLCSGFVYLLSTGTFTDPNAGSLAQSAFSGNAQQALSGAGVTYSVEQYAYIAFYFVMILWLVELCGAFSKFVMAYSVILWYFTPYNESGSKESVAPLAVLWGYAEAGRYHTGTLACGSFFAAVLGAIRMVAAAMQEQAKQTSNPVGQMVAACVGCCADCLKRILDLVNKNAYMDVAMNSSNYCEAAIAAVKVIAGAAAAIGVLTGTMWIMTFACVGAISGATGWAVFTYVSQQGTYNNPTAIAIGAMVVAALVSMVVMNVLDMVVDTILFCFATDKEDVKQAADKSVVGRGFGCCGMSKVAESANRMYHSEAAAKAMGKVGLDQHAPAQYVPTELRPLLNRH